MSFQSRNIEIPLIDNQIIYADSNSTYKLLFLDVPALEGLLPHAEGLWVESLLMNCAVDEIDWNIDAFVGVCSHPVGTGALQRLSGSGCA